MVVSRMGDFFCQKTSSLKNNNAEKGVEHEKYYILSLHRLW